MVVVIELIGLEALRSGHSDQRGLGTLISRIYILFLIIIINERHHFELYFLACNEIKAL